MLQKSLQSERSHVRPFSVSVPLSTNQNANDTEAQEDSTTCQKVWSGKPKPLLLCGVPPLGDSSLLQSVSLLPRTSCLLINRLEAEELAQQSKKVLATYTRTMEMLRESGCLPIVPALKDGGRIPRAR